MLDNFSWKLEIEEETLMHTIGDVIFNAVIPQNLPELAYKLGLGHLEDGHLTYTIEVPKEPQDLGAKVGKILNHPDVVLLDLEPELFFNKFYFDLNIIDNTLKVGVLYDTKNYLLLILLENRVYRFNLGFYLLMLELGKYEQKYGNSELFTDMATATDPDFFEDDSNDNLVN